MVINLRHHRNICTRVNRHTRVRLWVELTVIRSHDNHRTLLDINAIEIVSFLTSRVIALVIKKDLV